MGLVSVILGSAAWSAGAGGLVGTGSVRNPLAIVGFFGIFGLTFFGVGVVMLVADQQPNADHTTNVLTIIGIVFGVMGLGSMAAEVAFRLSGAANARVLATGIRGRATVTAVRDTNVTVNMNPMVALDLRVEIPGQPVFTTTMRQVISRLQVGSFQPGIVLSVAASRTRPRDIVIDWGNSPMGDPGDETDPVTGQQLTAASPPLPASGQSGMTVGGRRASGGDIATILRAAADQVAAGGTASHPAVANVIGNAGQWSATGRPMAQADVALLLRSLADRAAAGTLTSGSTGQAMTAGDLAALLRQASDAAASGTAGGSTGTSGSPSGAT